MPELIRSELNVQLTGAYDGVFFFYVLPEDFVLLHVFLLSFFPDQNIPDVVHDLKLLLYFLKPDDLYR